MKNMFLIISIFCLFGCFSKEPEKTGHEGQIMPSFKILLPDSSTYFDTKNIPAGHPFAVFLFNPQCPYCKAQMKDIIEKKDRLKDINFYVITTGPYSLMRKWYTYFELNKYSDIITGIDEGHFFADYLEVRGVPYLAIYGKDKKLRKAFIGKTYASQIAEVAND